MIPSKANTPQQLRQSVVVVEDNKQTLAYLTSLIDSMPDVSLAGSACTLHEGLAAMAAAQPDILLCDLELPDGNGMSLIDLAIETGTAAMVITIFEEEDRVISAIERGASGYLLKDQPRDVIKRAITDLMAGGSPITPSIASVVLKKLAPNNSQTPPAASDTASLTAREIEVLQLAAHGYQTKEVANMLALSRHTIANHYRNAYRKMKVKNRSEAVAVALKDKLIEP